MSQQPAGSSRQDAPPPAAPPPKPPVTKKRKESFARKGSSLFYSSMNESAEVSHHSPDVSPMPQSPRERLIAEKSEADKELAELEKTMKLDDGLVFQDPWEVHGKRELVGQIKGEVSRLVHGSLRNHLIPFDKQNTTQAHVWRSSFDKDFSTVFYFIKTA